MSSVLTPIKRLARHDWAPLALLLFALPFYFARLLTSPPGLSGDAAAGGLFTLDFLQHGVWPFYVYRQFSPTPLINYLQAPLFIVVGYRLTALRGLTAFAGVLTVPALYLAGREILAGRGLKFARRAGALAALGFALWPFFSVFSRQGLEAALLPLAGLLSIAALWKGLRRGRWTDFLLTGVVLGLSQYVYIVARVLPGAVAAACTVALLTERRLLIHWRKLALAAGTAAAIALPQWLLFLCAPYTFVARSQQAAGQFIFGFPNAASIFGAKLVNQLLMLGWRWDTGYYPESTRPILSPILLLGLLAALLLLLRSPSASQRFAWAVAVVMLVPDLITYQGLSPFATRLIGAFPLIYLLAGLGCAALWQGLESQQWLPMQVGWLIPLAVVLAGAESRLDFVYRVTPRVNAISGLEWRAGLVEIAEAGYIQQHLDRPILIPSSEYQRAPLAFLLVEHFPNRAGGLHTPLDTGETVTVVSPIEPERPTTDGPPSGYLPDEWVLLKDGAVYFLPPLPGSIDSPGAPESLYASNGALAAQAFTAKWTGAAPTIETASASFENGLDLVGYHVSGFAPGQSVTVTLYWRPQRQLPGDVQIFVQILDRHGAMVAGVHDWPLHGVYRARAWRPGETMPLSYQFAIPTDAAPGPYRLIAGVFDLLQQDRIPTADGSDAATVTTLKVPLPPVAASPAQTLSADFGDAIHLSGYTLEPTGDGLSLTLFWQARAAPALDYTAFVHIVDAAGNIVAQSDSQPLEGQYPTSIWSPGETIVEQRRLQVAPGEYQVFIGLYWWDGEILENLQVTLNGQRLPDDRLPLGSITVP